MVTPVGIIRNPGATVDRIVEVQPAGQTMVAGLKQFAQELNVQSEGVYMRERENAYNDYSVQLSESLDRIEQENISDPGKFTIAARNYYKGFTSKIKDQQILGALDKQFASWNMTASRRVRGNFENNLNQQAQYGTLKVLDRLESEMASIGPDFFNPDPVASQGAAVRFNDIMDRYRQAATQRRTDGSFLFTPEFAVNKEAQMVDRTISQALTNYVRTDKDPVATLQAIKENKMPDMSGVFGVANPLDLLSPAGRERAIALAEGAISERNKVILDGWAETKAAAELQIAMDPLKVDINKVAQDFFVQNEQGMTPETASKVRQEILGLTEKWAKDTKDYRLAAPFMSGEAQYDGTENSKKGIEKAFEVKKAQGESMADRAAWLGRVGYNDVPVGMINEMEATLQAAINTQDMAKIEAVAQTYDTLEKAGPAIYANLQSKMNDNLEAALMTARDLFRIEGVGKDGFNEMQRIMTLDATARDQRKKEIKALSDVKSYREYAAEALDPGYLSLQPGDKDRVTGQAAADYQKIFDAKYMATGDEKSARKATQKILSRMYGKTQFNPEGFMRTPPEAFYGIEGDPETQWMRDDLMAALASQPGVSVNLDPDRVQLIPDPNHDYKAGTPPKYLVAIKDEVADIYDTNNQVWYPDQKARREFLAQVKTNRIDPKYYTREVYNPVTKQTYSQNVGAPDYSRWVRDWYANGGQAKTKAETMAPESVFEKGIIPQESGGRQFDDMGRPLTSNKGAIGIAQVMPGTAPEAAQLAGVDFDEARYRTDPEYNKTLGRAYFTKQYDNFGDMHLAVMAYNAGPGAVGKHINKVGDPRKGEVDMDKFIKTFPAAETRNYVKKVIERVAYAD